jgi:hypothetical protein
VELLRQKGREGRAGGGLRWDLVRRVVDVERGRVWLQVRTRCCTGFHGYQSNYQSDVFVVAPYARPVTDYLLRRVQLERGIGQHQAEVVRREIIDIVEGMLRRAKKVLRI